MKKKVKGVLGKKSAKKNINIKEIKDEIIESLNGKKEKAGDNEKLKKIDDAEKNVAKKSNEVIGNLRRPGKSKVKISGNVAKVRKTLEWIEEMSVGNKTLDNQHKKLFGQIKKLNEEIDQGEELKTLRQTMHFLYQYSKEHFSSEEKYMKDYGFPKFQQHVRIHNNFIEFFERLKREFEELDLSDKNVKSKLRDLSGDCKKFLGDWWIYHIMGEDQEYHKYIDEHFKKNKVPKPVEKKDGVEKRSKKKSKKGDEGGKLSMSEIAAEIKREMISQQRKPVEALPALKGGKTKKDFVNTGVPGFDDLLVDGIPRGNAMIVAGGAGSGKTIFCIQTLVNQAKLGRKCLIMTLEEKEERLIGHMEDFGWPVKDLIKKGNLKIVRINPFDITRNVDALLAKQKGELLIDIDPVILPKDFSKPDLLLIDSLTAISSAFTGREESYRIYIEQLFRFLEKTGATSFLITETEQVPKIFSPTGVEEFLADGVVVLYALKHGNVRENALEILKLRGAAHQKKIVAMQITGQGMVVYPEQEVFSEI